MAIVPPSIYNFRIKQRETWTRTVGYPGGDQSYPDLTGYTAEMQIRQAEGTPVLIELTTENGRITLGAGNPQIALLIDAADTAALDWPEGDPAQYDLWIVSGSNRYPVIEGTVVLKHAITE